MILKYQVPEAVKYWSISLSSQKISALKVKGETRQQIKLMCVMLSSIRSEDYSTGFSTINLVSRTAPLENGRGSPGDKFV